MSGFRERDFIKRMIQQLAQGLARALKLRREQKYEQAQQALGELFDDLVGVPRELVDRMNVASAATLIGDAEKLRIWATLLKEEALILDAQGLDAQPVRARAGDVLAEAVLRSGESEADRELSAELLSGHAR